MTQRGAGDSKASLLQLGGHLSERHSARHQQAAAYDITARAATAKAYKQSVAAEIAAQMISGRMNPSSF